MNAENEKKEDMRQQRSPVEVPQRIDKAPRPVKEKNSPHREHLVRPPTDFAKRKATVFQIDRNVIEERIPIYVCGLDRRLKFHPKKKFDPSIYEVEHYLHRVTPKSLDQLKELVGVPNAVHLQAAKAKASNFDCNDHGRLRKAQMHNLPAGEKIHFNRLSPEERSAVNDLSRSLLMGYAEPEILTKAPYKAIVDYMLDRANDLPTFVGKDLIVCPDETVDFSGFAAVYFDNVIVIGNGKIVTGDNTKFHSYQIKHV